MEDIWNNLKKFLAQFTHVERRDRTRRYGLSILLPVIVLGLKTAFHNFLGDNSTFLLASFIVAISSWYGGFGPGLVATFLTAVFTFAFLIGDLAEHPITADLLMISIFIAEGVGISIINEGRYEMEEQKDEFIGFAAHEIKNPLTSIKGFSGLMVNALKKTGNPKFLSYTQEISFQADKILELINDLLDITKIEIGKFSYTNSFFSIDDLVKETVSHLKIISQNREIEVHGHSKKTIYGDKYRVGQVITNLLTNALKYSPDPTKVIIGLKSMRGGVLVSVKDFGIGMSKKDQESVFDRFYRTKKVRKNSIEGIGLGLYISNRIVHDHKGKIWIKSKEGKGSTFFVQFPTKISHA